jgi:hypothetical protein
VERSATESALLLVTVTLYGRATVTVGKLGERGSISIRDKLDDAQRADHDALADLRNRVVAHVHNDELVAGHVWHRQALYLVEVDNGWRPASAVVRRTLNHEALYRLERLLPVVHALLVARFHQHTGMIVDLMNEHGVSPTVFNKCRFDAAAFYGSEEELRKSLATMTTGYGAGWFSGAGR